jgi:O-antigen ligase
VPVDPWLLLLALGVAIAWLNPNHYYPWVAFDGEVSIAAVLVLGGIVFLVGVRRDWLFSPLAFGVGALALVPQLQYAFGLVMFWGDALVYSLYLFGLAAAIAWGGMLQRWRQDVVADVVLGAAITAAVLSVGVQLNQWLRLAELAEFGGLGIWIVPRAEGRPFGNLSQPNNLASVLVWGLIGLWWFRLRGALRGWVAAMAAALLLFGIVLTQSRAGWGALAVLLVLSVVFRGILRLRRDAIGVAILGVWTLALVAGMDALNRVLLLDDAPGLASRLALGPRAMTWRVLLDAIAMQPVFGYGVGQVAVAQEAAILLHPASGERFSYAHNFLLDLFLWFGLPLGMVVTSGVLFWILRMGGRLGAPAQVLLWCALITLGVHAMVEFPHAYAYFLLPAGLMMGALEASGPRSKGFCVPRISMGVALMAVAGLLVAIAFEYRALVDHTTQRRFEAARIGGTVAGSPPRVRLLTQLGAYSVASQLDVRMPLAPEQVQLLRAANLRFPSAPGGFRVAMASALAGDLQGAQEAMDRLCRYQVHDRCEGIRKAWLREAQGRSETMALVTVRDP